MGEGRRRENLGLNKIGSIRIPKKITWLAKSPDRCEKCGGKMYYEYGVDYYQDGQENYEILRCLNCDSEKRFNIEWEGFKS